MSHGTAVLEEVTQSPAVNSTIISAPQKDARAVPLWFRQQREQGWREFSTMPNPTRKDQAWRFSNVDALDLSPYRFGNAPSDDEQAEILERSAVLNGKSGRLIFANDQLLERDALPGRGIEDALDCGMDTGVGHGRSLASGRPAGSWRG